MESVEQFLLLLGSAVFVVLGLGHGVLTLRDLASPHFFTPTDDAVREAMQQARLALNPRANLWRAWIGFNLSHSLGLVLFGGAVFGIGWASFGWFAESVIVQGVVVLVAATYFVLSIRFWFWGPALATGIALLSFLGAAVGIA